MLRLPGSRCSSRAVHVDLGQPRLSPSRRRSRSAIRRLPRSPSRPARARQALPKPTMSGDVQRARAHAALVAAAVDHAASRRTRGLRRTYSAPTPLGPYILCADIAHQVDARALTSKGILPSALHRVAVEEHARSLAHRADLGDRLDHADLVVGGHDRDEDRLVGDGRLAVVQIDQAVGLRRQIGDLEAVAAPARLQVSSTALCSVCAVMMWLPLSL